jgi:hypothetical protein
VRLRQSYLRIAKQAAMMAGRYAHAKQFNRHRRQLRILRTRLGRIIRDIGRKIAGQPALQEAFQWPLARASQIRSQQQRQRGWKLYSFHAPEVECIGKGKASAPYSHYLVDPVACTPASGWEKGQVENQVGLVRERFFTPRLRFKNLDELNAWLLDKCIAYDKAHRHPEFTDKTIWDVFEAERPKLVPYAGRFDGFHAVPASVSKTCLVRFDNTKYSVAASAVGRPVEVHAYADRIVSARTAGSSLSIPARSAVARRSMTPGITYRCLPASPAPCATAQASVLLECGCSADARVADQSRSRRLRYTSRWSEDIRLNQNPILSIQRLSSGTGKPKPYPSATVFFSCPSNAHR